MPTEPAFVVDSATLDEGEARFRYRLGSRQFEEVVRLPGLDGATVEVGESQLEVAIRLVHLCAGVSYYKLSAPRVIEVPSGLTDDERQVVERLYDEGLREFAVTNGLPVPREVRIEAPVLPTPPAAGTAPPDRERALVPVGGGKDSAVVLAALPDATGLTINPTPAARRLAAAAGVPLLEVHRRLDPRLAELTQAGGLNGHVPVTAIVMAIATLVAVRNGFTAAVMGNERSASEPTRLVDGASVNHQYSKSFEFETVFAGATRAAGVTCFSLLRRLSEVAIAERLAAQPRLLPAFLSCNRSFTLDQYRRQDAAGQGWCLDCPKCRFTFLVLAPFLSRVQATAVFGGNPLADPAQTGGFAALWRDDEKPFECVGERAEGAAALAALSANPEWRDEPVVVALAREAALLAAAAGVSLSSLAAPGGPSRIPPAYAARLAALPVQSPSPVVSAPPR